MLGEVVAGRYRVVDRIGEGGHGSVWRADDLRAGRAVALKIMHEERDPLALQRFSREAELVQRLSHPSTVRLLDFGVHEHLPFSVFELLQGETLQQLLRREGPQPAERVAHVARSVLRALEEAHAVGIVHRDIKPANVFATSQGEIKLLDYGIAKSLRPNTKMLTRQGEVLGTPSYMTPELIEARPVTPASDLYALGLVMAELLSGQRVYQGSPIDICMRQTSPSPTPLPPEVLSSALGPVIARATEKAVERRYSSAAAMLGAIDAALSGDAQTARGWWSRLLWWRG